MNKYALVGIWYGIEDAHEEIIGIYDTREEARKQLIEMKKDINWDNLIIKEVKVYDRLILST